MTDARLDERLKDFSVPAATVKQVAKDHDCTDRAECPACGCPLTKREPLCLSAAVADGLLKGHEPHWHKVPQQRTASPAGNSQDGLFPEPERVAQR